MIQRPLQFIDVIRILDEKGVDHQIFQKIVPQSGQHSVWNPGQIVPKFGQSWSSYQ
jgi:hypothetical protein